MKNADIRRRLRAANIPLWRLGQKMGVTEVTVVRWFREELNEERRRRVLDALETLEREVAQNDND